MSFSLVLPQLSDDEIMAICDGMIGYAAVNAPDQEPVFSRPRIRHRFASDLVYADEATDLAGRHGVDIQTLIERVLDWNDAEFAGAIRMVTLFWQPRGPIDGRDEILAEIRAELSPTAHQCLSHARCLYAFRNGRQARERLGGDG